MRSSRTNTLITSSSIFIVVLMIGLYSFVYMHPQLVVDRMKEQLQIVVEMKQGHQVSADGVIQKLSEMEDIRTATIRWVPSKEAEREMRYEMGPLVDNLEGQSLFRDLVLFSVKAEFYDAVSLELIKQKVKKIEGVDEVFYQDKVASQLEDAVQSWSQVLLYGGSIFILIALLLIYNTLRLGLFADRNSIMTLDLMGARKSFIKRPYIWKSFKNGLLVGVLTILLVMLAVYALSRTYPEIWKVFLEDSFLLWALTVLSFSLLFNVLSTWVILSSFLKGRLKFS